MSKIEVDTIEPQSGTTVTIGASGDTITIPSGATLTNNGTQTGLTLSDNILFNTASKGIYLGVTSATASNLLDDYEEGTFTPVISGSTSGSGSPSGGTNSGRYTKIGNLVYVNYFLTNVTFPTFTGNPRISLPFAAASGSHSYWGDSTYFYPGANWETIANFVDIFLYTSPGQSVCNFKIYATDQERQSQLIQGTNCNLSAQSGLYFQSSMVYNTN